MPAAEDSSRSNLSVVTRGALVYFVSSLVLIGATFAWRVLLIRTLSVAGWNAFSDASAIAASVASVAGLGLGNTLARNIPYSTSDEERRAIVRIGLVIGGLSCAVLPPALYFAGPALATSTGSSQVVLGIQVFGLAYGLSTAVSLLASVFQGFENVWPGAIFGQVLVPGAFVGLLLGFYRFSGDALTFDVAVWSYATACAAAFVLILVYTLARLPRRLPRGPLAHGRARPLLLFALPLLGVSVFSTIDGLADTIILGAYHFSETGTYVASLTLARLVPIGISALAFIALPVTARLLRDGNRTQAGLTYATATKWTALFGLPLFLLFAFAPGPSLDLVYGPTYASITLPLVIVAAGSYFSTFVGPAPAVLISVGRVRWLFLNSFVSLCVDVGLAIALVPGYGLTGAALAWALATLIYPALAIVELAGIDHIHPFRRTYVVPLLATAVPCALVLSITPMSRVPLWWFPPIGIGLAVLYGTMVILTRSVDAGDFLLLDVLERLVHRRLETVRRWITWGSRLDH